MKLSKIVTIAALFAAATPAFAVSKVTTFDFSNLTSNAAASLLPSELRNTGYWTCGGVDICSSDIDGRGHNLGGDLKYTVNGITATASAYYTTGKARHDATVVQDADNGHNFAKQLGAGLGVYSKINDSSDDNVTSGETLVLSFASKVKLSDVFLRSEGHNTNEWIKDATFLLNGQSYALQGSIAGLDLVGKEFTFQFGGKHADQFYLGGMSVSAVPEPSSYAMLLGGVAMLGLIARRRKQQA